MITGIADSNLPGQTEAGRSSVTLSLGAPVPIVDLTAADNRFRRMHWKDVRDVDARQDGVPAINERTRDFYFDEAHRRSYGRPWVLGSLYFDFLRRLGMQPSHRVLDFGCGSGRLGIELVDYLDPGSYIGIDFHFDSLNAFAAYEIPMKRLAEKRPVLCLGTHEHVDEVVGEVDWVLDMFSTAHIPSTQRTQAFRSLLQCLRKGGRLVVNPASAWEEVEEQVHGIVSLQNLTSVSVDAKFVTDTPLDVKLNDRICIIRCGTQ